MQNQGISIQHVIALMQWSKMADLKYDESEMRSRVIKEVTAHMSAQSEKEKESDNLGQE